MGVHWTDKRAALAMLGGEMSRRGWKLYGWHEDRSDMMTDYWCPASWDGVATKDGAVLVVDRAEYNAQHDSGRQPVRIEYDRKPCSYCGGSGIDPSGWTLEAAQKEPERYNNETGPEGTVPLFPHVVSPIPFEPGANGRLLCRKCHRGEVNDPSTQRQVPDGDRWPEFQANPKSASWHIERDGKIIAKGSGVFTIHREQYEDDKPKLTALADRIEAAAAGKPSTNGRKGGNGKPNGDDPRARPAKFAGECGNCGAPFEAGAPIRWYPGKNDEGRPHTYPVECAGCSA